MITIGKYIYISLCLTCIFRVPRVCVKSAAAPLFQVNDEPQQLRVLCLSEALVAFAVAFQANGDGIGMPWLCLEDAKWLQKIGGRS